MRLPPVRLFFAVALAAVPAVGAAILLLERQGAPTGATADEGAAPATAPATDAAAPPHGDAEAGAEPGQLVDVLDLAPGIRLDIRYATEANFTGGAVYPAARCLLRAEVARRLAAVQRALEAEGLGLLVWDCYRPFSVQKRFFELVPDPHYVARPVERGGVSVAGSKHNRGAAVDVTLVDAEGRLLEMPTDFDDFSERAHRDFPGWDEEARKNAETLERVMVAHGFEPLPTEWWHFDGPDWESYPLADEPL